MVAFKGPNIILGLYKCNYSVTVKRELGAAAGQKQGVGQIKQGGGPDSACRPCVCQLCLGGQLDSTGAYKTFLHFRCRMKLIPRLILSKKLLLYATPNTANWGQ